jgi:hypothetical protein
LYWCGPWDGGRGIWENSFLNPNGLTVKI